MYVSCETPEQTHDRLVRVISQTSIQMIEEEFAYLECPASEFPFSEVANALAIVRDSEVWSVLRPATSADDERFAVFMFHFPEALDNSGFVGWLATLIKRELGTGVFVVCGQNSRRGGIFDYWGVPSRFRRQVSALLGRLQSGECRS